MAKINILSSKIFNRIAAGEVIERPFSVVKELVENSIDAEAKNITVKIADGGLSLISVIDDGVGIESTEIKNAILPHATSKISELKHLDNITTLGFRGEALASIVSVSKVSIKSKPKNQELGKELTAEGGEFIDCTDVGVDNGTEICVKNLFYNTPVRARFLKSTRSEENEITATMIRFCLGRSDISFKLIADDKVVLQTFGDGLESAFINIYGTDILKNCFYVCSEKNGIKISGYIGKQFFSKPNRNYQTLFLNGRYVVNQTISSAISNAYSSYLMKRQYPFFVLNVEMPSDAVDVNVHPNKIDVRFINNQIVYSAIYSVISKVLDGTGEALEIIKPEKPFYEKPQESQKNNNDFNKDYDTQNKFRFDNLFCNDVKKEAETDFSKIKTEEKEVEDIFALNKAYIESLENKKKEITEEQQSITIDRELKLIGQALNTFLIFEDGEDLFFIDQHAAHERVLFDKFKEEFVNKCVATQPLLLPYIITLSAIEFDFIKSKFAILFDMGIHVEEFGENTLRVTEIPSILFNMNINNFFNDILSEMYSFKDISLESVLFDKIAQKACKSAIKSGDPLSENEIKYLLTLIKGNLGLKCPHGRPIAIKITRTEIDKWFKRIV